MLSALMILRRSCSACLVRQPIDQWPRSTVPLVLDAPSTQTLNAFPVDIIHTVSRRIEPSSRSLLMGEHPHPWALLHAQVRKSRHRCSKPRRRFELLVATTLLSPEEDRKSVA